jgi:methionyl-tRNA formyltransferase
MTNKVNIALFVSSANLSNQVLEKLIKLKKKLNIFLVVSDIKFKRKLDKNNIKYFKWVNSSNYNSSNIMKMLEISKDKNLYAFSLQYQWKITKNILEKFKIFFSFHFGELTKYRGHHPILHAILNNENFLYGTIHVIDEKLDNGKILTNVKVKNQNISSKDIEKLLAIKFANSFENLIIRLIDKKKLVYKKIAKKEERFYSINSIQKLKKVKNFNEILSKSRAFDYEPHEPAYIEVKNTKIYLKLKPY